MRVSPVAWYAKTLDETEYLAKLSAMSTYNHEEGIKGAQATAAAIFLTRDGKSKEYIKTYISNKYNYDLDRTIKEIRDSGYKFSSHCQTSVPEAIIAFLESNNFEEAIRKAVWLRGDADTQAAIATGIAHAFYNDIPDELVEIAYSKLPQDILEILIRWNACIANKK